MLLISMLFGLLPLAGVVWILVASSIASVDGLFMSLILLIVSAIFFLNVFLELRERGVIGKGKGASSKAPPAPKAE
jgi:hypothetical protein